MKVAAEFSNETEAQLLKDILRVQNIEGHIQGAKEYASIVLGGNDGRYQLLVPDEDLERAQKIIHEAQNRPYAVTEGPTENYFRRAVFYAFAAALILPIVFNYVSLQKGAAFWRQSKKDTSASLKLALILLLQVPTIVALIYSVQTIKELIQQILAAF